MRKICIINQKGGVGKTTTTINLAAGLSRENRKVLIVDLDPQGNISTSLNFHAGKDIYDLLFNNAKLDECIIRLGKNLDIISSKETLTKAEVMLQQTESKELLLRAKLKGLEKNYDYVIIDCPPSLGILNQNAILYSEEAIIPVSTDFLGYDALEKINSAINDINSYFDHYCKISKIVPTMFDKRNKLARDILNLMNSNNYGIVAEPIKVCSKIKEAPKEGKSVLKHAPRSRGAKDYMTLVKHIIYDEPKDMYENPIASTIKETSKKKAKLNA